MTVLHENASLRSMAIVRCSLFGLWAVKLLFDPLEGLAELPVNLFDPPAPLRFLPHSFYPLLLSTGALLTFRLLTVVALSAAALGRGFLWTAPLCCLLLTGHQSLVRGFGHLNHSELVPLLALYVMTICAWADRLERVQRPAYPLIGIVLLMCLSYALVGTNRLVRNGFRFFLTPAIEIHVLDTSTRLTYFEFGLGPLLLDYPATRWLLRFGFAATTAAEILAPLCLVSRWFRTAFLLVMVPFLVLSLLALNIGFIENLLLMALVAFDLGDRRSTLGVEGNNADEGLILPLDSVLHRKTA